MIILLLCRVLWDMFLLLVQQLHWDVQSHTLIILQRAGKKIEEVFNFFARHNIYVVEQCLMIPVYYN